MRLSEVRQDRLVGVRLQCRPQLDGAEARRLFSEPGLVIDVLGEEFLLLWDLHRADTFDDRVTGVLELASGAYVQWIGYGHGVVVEISSNRYLRRSARLDESEEARLVGCGFSAPDSDEPNFWLEVLERDEAPTAAFAVVAALTSVFGVYAG